MQTYHTRDGTQVAEQDAVDASGCVRDGISIRTKATLMDGVQRDTFVPLTDEQKIERIDRYNARLSDAWRNPAPLAAPAAVSRPATSDLMDTVYERHDRRLQDAWKQPAH